MDNEHEKRIEQIARDLLIANHYVSSRCIQPLTEAVANDPQLHAAIVRAGAETILRSTWKRWNKVDNADQITRQTYEGMRRGNESHAAAVRAHEHFAPILEEKRKQREQRKRRK